jgi:2-amino-4-hydroxy-6-hydroxymethyldihydropteridine diphosphokinase
MTRVFLSLGTNKGDRRANMESMVQEICRILVDPILFSRMMETEPVGVDEAQDWFLNQIISGLYQKSSAELLDACLAVEQKLGRIRTRRFEPRVADVDVLLFGNEVIIDDHLQIPHPGIVQRRFCLEGINDIDPEIMIPGTNKPIKDLYKAMDLPVAQQKIRYLS